MLCLLYKLSSEQDLESGDKSLGITVSDFLDSSNLNGKTHPSCWTDSAPSEHQHSSLSAS